MYSARTRSLSCFFLFLEENAHFLKMLNDSTFQTNWSVLPDLTREYLDDNLGVYDLQEAAGFSLNFTFRLHDALRGFFNRF